MESAEVQVVKSFVGAINRGDVSELARLMSDGHTFVDSEGRRESGKDRLLEGWGEYFRLFPDYRVEIQDVLQEGSLVAVFGSAAGTYNGRRGLVPANRIEMPAAWKAVIENGRVKLWQVYADWTTGWKTIEEDKASG
jgi:ketosteroid isomerase-like protein